MIEYNIENIKKFADYLINGGLTEKEIKEYARQHIERELRLDESVFRYTVQYYLGDIKEI